MEKKTIGIGCGIGCVGVLALLACGGIGAKIWWDNNAAGILEQGLEEMNAKSDAGMAFAATSDAEACVVEAVTRADGCGATEMGCQVDAAMFAHGCLQVAKRPDGFCDIPKLASTMKEAAVVAAWRTERCEALGHPGERCEQILVQQQSACER